LSDFDIDLGLNLLNEGDNSDKAGAFTDGDGDVILLLFPITVMLPGHHRPCSVFIYRRLRSLMICWNSSRPVLIFLPL